MYLKCEFDLRGHTCSLTHSIFRRFLILGFVLWSDFCYNAIVRSSEVFLWSNINDETPVLFISEKAQTDTIE